MNTLSELEADLINGGASLSFRGKRDWNQCKSDVLGAAGIGAVAGGAIGTPFGGIGGAFGAGIGLLGAGAYAASNSPSCTGGNSSNAASCSNSSSSSCNSSNSCSAY